MKFKTYDLLSDYLIGEGGIILELSTGEAIPLTPQKSYLLLTDEAGPKGSRLKRRFTPDEITKMFNSPKAKDYKEGKVKIVTPQVESSDTIKAPYLLINGVKYQSSRIAAETLGGNYNTILRKCKANKDGYFYIAEE